MNAFQTCRNSHDAVPLYLPQQLYLKPIAQLKISVQLPRKTMGKSISNWEVMEKLRQIVKPDELTMLKVTKTNLEVIRLEAEIDEKKKLEQIVAKLDNKTIKLKDFPELVKVRACETKLNFPARHMWDSFFHEAKHMNEMKPGERPDTIHISNLPIKWFVPSHLCTHEDIKPSEKIFYRIFEKFGQIRRVDIPICDPYRSQMKLEVSGMQVFDFNEEHFFEGYVQFKDYVGFTRAMDALRGMKLLHKEEAESYAVNITVDFDKTKHLSDASVRRREIVRDRLIRKEVDKEEMERRVQEEEEQRKEAQRQKELEEKSAKEKRRREREERRKARILAKLKVKGADEINEKIAKEEKKLLKVQRKLEAIRLVEELFRRIKLKKEKDLVLLRRSENEDELTRLKNTSELEVRQQRDKLNQVIEGRVVLKSILSGGPRIRSHYDSTSSDSSDEKSKRHKVSDPAPVLHPPDTINHPADWLYPSTSIYPYPIYHPIRGNHSGYFPYPSRGRLPIPGPSRGSIPRRPRGRYRGSYRGGKMPMYPPELQEQYYRYFEKFLHEHDDRSNRSYSRSRSRSHSRRRRSRSRSRTRRSYSKGRSRSRSSRRSHSPRRSRSPRKSRSPRRSRSPKRSRNRRSRSRSKKKSSRRENKSRTRSKTPEAKRKSRSPSYQSIDSSKFISPSRLRLPRSKSWSLPKEDEKNGKKRSWSRTPPPREQK